MTTSHATFRGSSVSSKSGNTRAPKSVCFVKRPVRYGRWQGEGHAVFGPAFRFINMLVIADLASFSMKPALTPPPAGTSRHITIRTYFGGRQFPDDKNRDGPRNPGLLDTLRAC
jgi:hypothetical protein